MYSSHLTASHADRTCYFWLPLWGVTCSLLYLSRTHSKRQDTKHQGISAVSGDTSSFCNPLINSVDHRAEDFFFDPPNDDFAAAEETSSRSQRSVSPRSRPSTVASSKRFAEDSFDSNDPRSHDGMLRLDSSTVYGGSEGGLSGHTDQLFGATDTEETEHMFGSVFSPDNSIHMYRDSSLFSPAVHTLRSSHSSSPKEVYYGQK